MARRVRLATRAGCGMTASVDASRVPPTQNPSALSRRAPAMSKAASRGASTPSRGVVVPGGALECAAGVAPRHHEDLQALVQRKADERVLRPQVEDVVLVDEGRDDEQGPRVHAGCARRVLNELRHRVLVDHGARCDRQVASDREGALVAHLHAAAQRVDFQIVQPRGEAGAARLRGDAQHFRVAWRGSWWGRARRDTGAARRPGAGESVRAAAPRPPAPAASAH